MDLRRGESAAVAVASVAVALFLGRLAWGTPGSFLGHPSGEGFGRLFVYAQLRRWLSGEASFGQADLLGWPDSVPFWPVDPVLSFPAAVLGGLVGDTLALNLVVTGLVALCGWGTWRLARTLGASLWGSVTAALLVQFQPVLWLNAGDTVVEMLCGGVAALTLVVVVDALRGNPVWRAGLAGLILGGCSPYLAAYIGTGFALLSPWLLWRYRARALATGTALAVGFALAAAPLVAAERYEGGRLDHVGGYDEAPERWSIPQANGVVPVRRIVVPDAGLKVLPEGVVDEGPEGRMRDNPAPAPPPPKWHRYFHATPGGVALLVAVFAGFFARRSRWVALLAFAILMLGPGPPQLARVFRVSVTWEPPLQQALRLLPDGGSLGNQGRWLVLYGLTAAMGAALLVRRRTGALILSAGAVAGGLAHQGDAAFSASRTPDLTGFDVGDGPLVVFPSGDGPFWNPGVPAKLVHYVGAQLGAHLPEDYGRGEMADWAQALRVELARLGRVPCGSHLIAEPLGELPEGTQVLVLDPFLVPDRAEVLHRSLETAWGAPRVTTAWGRLYEP